jgi:hypothetical protein
MARLDAYEGEVELLGHGLSLRGAARAVCSCRRGDMRETSSPPMTSAHSNTGAVPTVFRFDVRSPCAWLGAMQVNAVARRCRRSVEWRAMRLDAVFRYAVQPALPPATSAAVRLACPRTAGFRCAALRRDQGVPLKIAHAA